MEETTPRHGISSYPRQHTTKTKLKNDGWTGTHQNKRRDHRTGGTNGGSPGTPQNREQIHQNPNPKHKTQKDIELGQPIRKIYNLIRQVHYLDNVSVKKDTDNKKQPDYLKDIIKSDSMRLVD